jgi:uncharacterized RDD family membrane protein YckC
MEANKQFSPPRSFVTDVEPDAADPVKASRATRLGAKLIDSLIYAVLIMPAVIITLRAMPNSARVGGSNYLNAEFYMALPRAGLWFYGGLLGLLIVFIVNLVLLQRNGQSIGKRMLGIRIVRTDGSRATLARLFWLRAVVSNLLSQIPVVGRFYALADPLVIFGAEQRCIHDYLADTIVVQA